MKYYVVSESELEQLQHYTTEVSVCDYEELALSQKKLQQASEACRARPVPEWATHFARACPRNLEELVFDSSEEIKR